MCSTAHANPPSHSELGDAVRAILRTLHEHPAPPELLKKGRFEEATQHYFETAAKSAIEQATAVQQRAFLIALAYFLDETQAMARLPITPLDLKDCPKPPQHVRHLTLQGRHDWLQHFVVAAGLTALTHPRLAELASIQKEITDAKTGSGFSFADLQADLAGIELARRLQADPKMLASHRLRISWLCPDPGPFPEGIGWEQFQREYGSIDSAKTRSLIDRMRRNIDAAYEWAADPR